MSFLLSNDGEMIEGIKEHQNKFRRKKSLGNEGINLACLTKENKWRKK